MTSRVQGQARLTLDQACRGLVVQVCVGPYVRVSGGFGGLANQPRLQVPESVSPG